MYRSNTEVEAVKWEVVNAIQIREFCHPLNYEVLEDQRLAILCDPMVVVNPGHFILKFGEGLFYPMNPILFSRLFAQEEDWASHVTEVNTGIEERIRCLEENTAVAVRLDKVYRASRLIAVRLEYANIFDNEMDK